MKKFGTKSSRLNLANNRKKKEERDGLQSDQTPQEMERRPLIVNGATGASRLFTGSSCYDFAFAYG